jgi:hypothetical protein
LFPAGDGNFCHVLVVPIAGLARRRHGLVGNVQRLSRDERAFVDEGLRRTDCNVRAAVAIPREI